MQISFFVFYQTTAGMKESYNEDWQQRLQLHPGCTNWKIVLFVDLVSHNVIYHYYSSISDM